VISRDTYIELTKFGIVGGICFALDLSIYYSLTEGLGFATWLGKGISVVTATTVNYQLNKSWTWGQSPSDNSRFTRYMLLYAVSGMLNVFSNEVFLKILPDNEFQMFIMNKNLLVQKPFFTIKLDKFLAVMGATVVGMVVNFIGQKSWVFKDSSSAGKFAHDNDLAK
jgi:putative flippase GtrA